MPKKIAKRGRPETKGTKRKGSQVEKERAPKRSPFEQDVDKIVNLINEAGKRGYPVEGPSSNLEMMKKCACPALVEYKEDRHEHQTMMVGMLENGLTGWIFLKSFLT